MVCAKLLVTGLVQGVGFRYFVLRLANQLGLNGYVKNRSDGSVEIETEGEKEIIERFKANIEQSPGYSEVEQVEISYEIYSAKYDKFSVEY